ncbi:acetylcholinesterase-like isoform X2 [Emys orbicularis]|uniref:acetylcholinesterase-like isoform X2 n=1 Tax=Emys orbicularis TaxID=82168 RepID=UPI0031FD0E57
MGQRVPPMSSWPHTTSQALCLHLVLAQQITPCGWFLSLPASAMLALLPVLPCLLLLLSLLGPGSASVDGTVVLTSSGPVRGKHLLAGSSTVTAFLGIPYAKPPMGPLRFKKPVPHKPWRRVLEATSYGNSCPQQVFSGYPGSAMWLPTTPLSEDCLFLNLWVPQPQPQVPALVPILVWIHSGGFFIGTASLDVYDGRFLAATESVIVASMNYRLGALGFLSLPPAAPGNAGLWDQRLALRWLQKNAAAFGGDPARMMLFGQSAGGASVAFHLLSPGSRHLFARAALQSGVANAPWASLSPKEARERARALGRLMGCGKGSDGAVVDCLKRKDSEEFVRHDFTITRNKRLVDFPFLPTVDGDFLPDEPRRLLEAGHIHTKPILTGITANEGSMFLMFGAPGFSLGNDSLIGWEELVEGVRFMVLGLPKLSIQAAALRYSQEGKARGLAQHRWAMNQAANDYLFLCPMTELAGQLANAGTPTYVYFFAHRSSGSLWPHWMGAVHTTELLYLFGTLASEGGANHTYTEAEAALSHRVMRYWAEFARTGSPTGPDRSKGHWPLYNTTEQNFFHISKNESQVKGPLTTRHCSFWARLERISGPKEL